MSINIGALNQSSYFPETEPSPLRKNSVAQDVVNSARREASELDIGLSSMNSTSKMPYSGFISPARQRKSNVLIYGSNQKLRRVKLKIQEQVDSSTFRDKITVEQNAANLIRSATRIDKSQDQEMFNSARDITSRGSINRNDS